MNERRAFVNKENLELGRFLGADEQLLIVRWERSYRCDCGFVCAAPGDIFNHTLVCKAGCK